MVRVRGRTSDDGPVLEHGGGLDADELAAHVVVRLQHRCVWNVRECAGRLGQGRCLRTRLSSADVAGRPVHYPTGSASLPTMAERCGTHVPAYL